MTRAAFFFFISVPYLEVFTQVYLGDDLLLFGGLVFPVEKKGGDEMKGELEGVKCYKPEAGGWNGVKNGV